jgi:hypothetical protein
MKTAQADAAALIPFTEHTGQFKNLAAYGIETTVTLEKSLDDRVVIRCRNRQVRRSNSPAVGL